MMRCTVFYQARESYFQPTCWNIRNLLLHHTDFFIPQSYTYLFQKVVDKNIYADRYFQDFGDTGVAIQNFAYLNEQEFPFYHAV